MGYTVDDRRLLAELSGDISQQKFEATDEQAAEAIAKYLLDIGHYVAAGMINVKLRNLPQFMEEHAEFGEAAARWWYAAGRDSSPTYRRRYMAEAILDNASHPTSPCPTPRQYSDTDPAWRVLARACRKMAAMT